jgi:hypothetical protein
VQLIQAKPGCSEQRVDLAVEVTAARASGPEWTQAVLPNAYAGVRGEAMFDERELTPGSQHATYFA